MKRKLTLVILLIVSIATAGTGFAVSNKCKVLEVDEKKLVLECERDTEGLAAGDQVIVSQLAEPKEGMPTQLGPEADDEKDRT